MVLPVSRIGSRAAMVSARSWAACVVQVEAAPVAVVQAAAAGCVAQVGGGFGGGGGATGRYNLTFSINFNNILNHVNFNNPVGNIGSNLFGQSTATSGGFGGFGGAGGAYNRRIDAQIRFSF